MEKIRGLKIIRVLCKWYFGILFPVFVLWDIFVWILYIQEENVPKYCINVAVGEGYDFLDSEGYPCKIDWWYFITQPLLGSIIVFTVLFSPVLAFWYFSKRYQNR